MDRSPLQSEHRDDPIREIPPNGPEHESILTRYPELRDLSLSLRPVVVGWGSKKSIGCVDSLRLRALKSRRLFMVANPHVGRPKQMSVHAVARLDLINDNPIATRVFHFHGSNRLFQVGVERQTQCRNRFHSK